MSVRPAEPTEPGMSAPTTSSSMQQQKLNSRSPSPFTSCDRIRRIRQAALPIKFVIIGASISGLSCAIELRLAGHDVHVVEAVHRSELGRSPSGIRIPPNMSKLLLRWDLGAEFKRKLGRRVPSVLLHSAHTGEHLGNIVFHKEVMKVMEADFLNIHHGDLVYSLYRYASKLGAHFDFDARVVSIDQSNPSVTLANGRKVFGDILIGADGERSVLRRYLQGGDVRDSFGPYTTSMTTLPVSDIEDDERLMMIVKGSHWDIWMGDEWAAFAYPIRDYQEMAVMLYVKDGEKQDSPTWRETIAMEDINIDVSTAEPSLRRLLSHVKTLVRTRDYVHEPLDNWFDGDGRMLIVGQAAHASSPAGNHPAALCVEDAVILGGLFQRLKSRSQITRLLSAFQDLRESRWEIIKAAEADRLGLVTMVPSPLRDQIHATLRKEMEVALRDFSDDSDEYMRMLLEEFANFGYDAVEEVDTWWVEWGCLLERMDNTNGVNGEDAFEGQIRVQNQKDVV